MFCYLVFVGSCVLVSLLLGRDLYTVSLGDSRAVLARQNGREGLVELQLDAELQCLEIENYIGDRLPCWFSSLSKIKKLRLDGCSLEYLDISARGLQCLEVLHLHHMRLLRGWWRGTTSPRDNEPTSIIETLLPCVSKLEIEHCESLVENMPLFAAVEHLILKEVNVGIMKMLLRNPQCKDNYKLQILHLRSIEGLECLAEGLIKTLTAPKTLYIFGCKKLCWVSRRGLECLTSLTVLRISDCGGVRLEDEDGDDKCTCAEIDNIKSSVTF